MNKNTRQYVIIAMIAAIYAAISLAIAPLSYGPIQIRIAEALTLLPLIYFPSVFGVALGCFITNLIGAMTGVNILGYADVVIGTLATVVAAYITYKFRNNKIKGLPLMAILSPVIVNGIIIGIELGYAFYPNNMLIGSLISGLQVAIGELISVIIGYYIVIKLDKKKIFD